MTDYDDSNISHDPFGSGELKKCNLGIYDGY
jgi:hypothetical protein